MLQKKKKIRATSNVQLINMRQLNNFLFNQNLTYKCLLSSVFFPHYEKKYTKLVSFGFN